MPFLLRHSVAPCQEVSSATQTLPSKGEAVFRLHALMNLRGESLLKIRASSVQPTANSRRPGAGRAQGPAPNGVSGGLRAPEPKQSGRPRGQRCGWGHRRAQRGQAALGATSFTPLTPATGQAAKRPPAACRSPRGPPHSQPLPAPGKGGPLAAPGFLPVSQLRLKPRCCPAPPPESACSLPAQDVGLQGQWRDARYRDSSEGVIKEP